MPQVIFCVYLQIIQVSKALVNVQNGIKTALFLVCPQYLYPQPLVLICWPNSTDHTVETPIGHPTSGRQVQDDTSWSSHFFPLVFFVFHINFHGVTCIIFQVIDNLFFISEIFCKDRKYYNSMLTDRMNNKWEIVSYTTSWRSPCKNMLVSQVHLD